MAAAATMTYLSHRDLALQLNNVSCDMIQGPERVELLGGAVSTLRDALDALGRPPVAVEARGCNEGLEEYVAYRAELWGRAEERAAVATTDEAAILKLTEPIPSAPTPSTAEIETPRRRKQFDAPRVDPLVYAEPLRLEVPEDNSHDSHGETEDSLEEVSAAVLFNLSLAHHLAGERTGIRAYIDRAVRFYKMTETMVMKALTQTEQGGGSSPSREPAEYLATIVKAVLNNTGQICIQWMGEPQLGREYFAKLASISANAEGDDAPMEEAPSLLAQQLTPAMDAFAFNAMVTGGMNAAGAA